MPKLKTKKSITKRFKFTKTGKVMRKQSFRRHLNVKKSKKRKRRLKRTKEVKTSFAKRLKKAIGAKKRS
jgi:large subunit ribosomal protein L35